jgi:hypothetical protein
LGESGVELVFKVVLGFIVFVSQGNNIAQYSIGARITCRKMPEPG